MYLVTVYIVNTGKAVLYEKFDFGKFTDIGFWLDHHGYIDPEYKVEIRFTD